MKTRGQEGQQLTELSGFVMKYGK